MPDDPGSPHVERGDWRLYGWVLVVMLGVTQTIVRREGRTALGS